MRVAGVYLLAYNTVGVSTDVSFVPRLCLPVLVRRALSSHGAFSSNQLKFSRPITACSPRRSRSALRGEPSVVSWPACCRGIASPEHTAQSSERTVCQFMIMAKSETKFQVRH